MTISAEYLVGKKNCKKNFTWVLQICRHFLLSNVPDACRVPNFWTQDAVTFCRHSPPKINCLWFHQSFVRTTGPHRFIADSNHCNLGLNKKKASANCTVIIISDAWPSPPQGHFSILYSAMLVWFFPGTDNRRVYYPSVRQMLHTTYRAIRGALKKSH